MKCPTHDAIAQRSKDLEIQTFGQNVNLLMRINIFHDNTLGFTDLIEEPMPLHCNVSCAGC